MLKPSRIGLIAACAVLCTPYAVNAATVTTQAGTVLVSKGEGFASIATDAEVAPGARVMVQPGGLAVISYSNNCVVRVGSGVWTVQQAAPCAPGTKEIDFTGRMNQAGPEEGGGIGTGWLIVGGVLVAGGVAGLIIYNNNNKDKSHSP